MIDVKLKGFSNNYIFYNYKAVVIQDEKFDICIKHPMQKDIPFKIEHRDAKEFSAKLTSILPDSRILYLNSYCIENIDEIRNYFRENDQKKRIDDFMFNSWGYVENNKQSLAPEELKDVAIRLSNKAVDLLKEADKKIKEEQEAIKRATVKDNTEKTMVDKAKEIHELKKKINHQENNDTITDEEYNKLSNLGKVGYCLFGKDFVDEIIKPNSL